MIYAQPILKVINIKIRISKPCPCGSDENLKVMLNNPKEIFAMKAVLNTKKTSLNCDT